MLSVNRKSHGLSIGTKIYDISPWPIGVASGQDRINLSGEGVHTVPTQGEGSSRNRRQLTVDENQTMTTFNNKLMIRGGVTTLPYPTPFSLRGLLLHERPQTQWRCKRQYCVVRYTTQSEFLQLVACNRHVLAAVCGDVGLPAGRLGD